MKLLSNLHKSILILFLILLSACDKNPTSPEKEEALEGHIENWYNGGFRSTLYICVGALHQNTVSDSVQLTSDGDFSIPLPLLTPPDSILKFFTLSEDSNELTIKHDKRVFSNLNTRYTMLLLQGFFQPKTMRYNLYAQTKSPTADSIYLAGDCRFEYYYFTEPTTIKGFYSLSITSPGLNFSYVTNYNVSVSAGWNQLKTTITFIDDQKIIYEVTSGNFVSDKWFAAAYILYGFNGLPLL